MEGGEVLETPQTPDLSTCWDVDGPGKLPCMGVAFVFVIYVTALAIGTIPVVLIGLVMGWFLSRGAYRKLRRPFLIAGGVSPVLAAGYVLFCIVALAAFGLLTHRDFGFGDGFEIPLHNGYQFSAIDIPDIATLYRRGSSLISDGSSDQISRSHGPVVDNVFALQQSGDWIYGARGTSNPRFGDNKRVPERWFLLNTRTLKLQEVDSNAKFQGLINATGLSTSLQDAEVFYGTNRYRWYDWLALLLLAVPPLLAMWLIYKTVKRMRHWATSASVEDDPDETGIRYPSFLRLGRFPR